jgi:hypothetical protein
MGLEFSFDDTLDQQVSRDQLEIDLYDELITISDAEPDEQVRMLATKPATVVGHQENDKPESIRVTGSLGRERGMSDAPAMPIGIGPEQASMPADGPPPANPAQSAAILPGSATPTASNGQNLAPARLASATPMTAERRPAPVEWPPDAPTMHVKPPLPLPTPTAQALAPPPKSALPPVAPPRAVAPPPVAPPKAAPVTAVPDTRFVNKCPDCGQPAGDLDMICIECGGFIG